jgi:hypothetical protein
MQIIETLSTRNYKAGYVVNQVLVDGMGGEPFKVKQAVTPDGLYIGDPKWAFILCKKRGIKPELAKPTHSVCSIGFNETEQRWYGWSHRAMAGFGIGSSVKRGDCGYVPVDWEDARADAVRFWSDDWRTLVTAVDDVDEAGRLCFRVEWSYTETVPNAALRSKISGARHYPPETFGRGEWTAETLADAKQMAIDFAEGVS